MRYEKSLFIALVLTAIVIPIIVLFLYREYVSGLPATFDVQNISRDSSKWSDFGSLLSGLFTLSGALATIATLIFAISQNKKLAREAEKRSQLDAKNAEKNEKFMAFQKERMSLEKYRLHQLMFNDLLDRIEIDAKSELRFYSRSDLYKGIFPNNSFDECSTKVNKNELGNKNIFNIISLAKIINQKIESDNCENDGVELLNDFINMFNLLHVSFRRETKAGDITFGDNSTIINLIDMHSTIGFFNNTVSALCDFCEINDKLQENEINNPFKCLITLFFYASSFTVYKDLDATFPYGYISSDNLSKAITILGLFSGENIYSPAKNMEKVHAHIIDSLSPENIHAVTSDSGLKKLLHSTLEKCSRSRDKKLDKLELKVIDSKMNDIIGIIKKMP